MSQNRLHDFERDLNRKLDGHELDVPEHIWSAIEADRHPVKSERWPVLLLLLLFAGLGGSAYWAFNVYSEDSSVASSEIVVQNGSANANDLGVQYEQNQKSNVHKTSDRASSASLENTKKGMNERQTSANTNEVSKFKTSAFQDGAHDAENASNNSLALGAENTVSISREKDLAQRRLLQKKEQFSIVSPLERNDGLFETENWKKSLQCPVFSDKGLMTDVSIEFGLGPALSFHQLSVEPGYENFLTARLVREQPLVNYGAHLRLKKEWANNTTASIGFNLNSFNYQFKRADSNEVRRTIITIDTFYQGHDFTTTVDTLLLVEQGIQEHRSGMTHRVLSLPVSFGYKMEIDRLFVEPYLGATFNVFQQARWSKDIFSDLIEGPVDDVMAYRTKLGVMAHVGLTLGYELNSRWSVILQPEYHHSWKSITEPDRPLTENRNWININAGVKYKLWQTKKVR